MDPDWQLSENGAKRTGERRKSCEWVKIMRMSCENDRTKCVHFMIHHVCREGRERWCGCKFNWRKDSYHQLLFVYNCCLRIWVGVTWVIATFTVTFGLVGIYKQVFWVMDFFQIEILPVDPSGSSRRSLQKLGDFRMIWAAIPQRQKKLNLYCWKALNETFFSNVLFSNASRVVKCEGLISLSTWPDLQNRVNNSTRLLKWPGMRLWSWVV